MPHHYVYYLHAENQLVYIGRSDNPRRRQALFKKRTGIATSLGICQRFTLFQDAADAEIKAILKHRPKFNKKVISSAGTLGRARTAEERLRISIGNTGNAGCAHFKGKKHTDETLAKMSKSQQGHPVSDETKEKIRQARLGNTFRLGKKHSPEAKANMRAARQARSKQTIKEIYGNEKKSGSQGNPREGGFSF